jgi:diaminopimelate epimerase
MKLRFAKMQGQGNDFVVIDGVRQDVTMTTDLARRIADRHFGVGCDQVLLVERPALPGNDFKYRIWNADGGEVEQCGNGARCFARFVLDEGLTPKRRIRVETASGVIAPHVELSGQVSVDMGRPRFDPREVPFRTPDAAPTYDLVVGNATITVSVLSMGNPHAVQVVDDVDAAPVRTQGPLIENHRDFPRRVNAGYMQILSPSRIRLRVWERGAGETLACGTGACAAAVSGIRLGLLESPVVVETRGGELTIEWPGQGSPVIMTGDAVRVFDGELEI